MAESEIVPITRSRDVTDFNTPIAMTEHGDYTL